MPWSHHAFRRCLCTLHYLTSSSSSSGNVRRENWNGLRRRRRRRCRKARSQFRNQIGPPNDRLFARSPVRPRPFYVEMWLVMFPNENGDWGGTSNGERKEGRNTDFTARWNMKVTTTTNLIAAMSLKSETRIRRRDGRGRDCPLSRKQESNIKIIKWDLISHPSTPPPTSPRSASFSLQFPGGVIIHPSEGERDGRRGNPDPNPTNETRVKQRTGSRDGSADRPTGSRARSIIPPHLPINVSMHTARISAAAACTVSSVDRTGPTATTVENAEK